MARNDFKPDSAVSKPELLFGWSVPQKGERYSELDKAFMEVESGTSLIIRGERRSGKTSFLRCLETKLQDEFPGVTPVWVDFYTFSEYSSPEKAFALILGECLDELEEDDRIDWAEEIERFRKDAEETASCTVLKKSLVKLDRLLKKHDHGLYIFFDEFEKVMEAFGEDSQHFSLFRDFQQRSEDFKGIHCVLAVAKDIQQYANQAVSSLFNAFVGFHELRGISQPEFCRLWRHHLGLCSEDVRRDIEDGLAACGGEDALCRLCGGRPAYAKMLGARWGLGERDILPRQLQMWFAEIRKRQSEEGRSILSALAKGLPPQNSVEALQDLLALGLVEKDGNGYAVSGLLWKQYLEDYAAPVPSSVANRIDEIRTGTDYAHWLFADLVSDREDLARLSRLSGETHSLEYKASIYIRDGEDGAEQPKLDWEIGKAVISLANCGGGALLIGVDDNGHPVKMDKKYGRDSCGTFTDFTKRLLDKIVPPAPNWKLSKVDPDRPKNKVNEVWRVNSVCQDEYQRMRDTIEIKPLADSEDQLIVYVPKLEDVIMLEKTVNGRPPSNHIPVRPIGRGEVRLCAQSDKERCRSDKEGKFGSDRFQQDAQDLIKKMVMTKDES